MSASDAAPPDLLRGHRLTPEELRARWRDEISLSTLATWRSRGTGPAYIKVGGKVLYPLAAVEQYERKNLRGKSA